MSNIIKLPRLWHSVLDAESMLNAIAADKPKHAFVICWPEDGSMPTYHSTTEDTSVVVYRINEFIHKLYSGDFA